MTDLCVFMVQIARAHATMFGVAPEHYAPTLAVRCLVLFARRLVVPLIAPMLPIVACLLVVSGA